MDRKLRVGILFGGRSAEHEVSIQSARNVIDAIDRDKYEVHLIGIDKEGRWKTGDLSGFILNSNNPDLFKLNMANENLALIPGKSESKLMKSESREQLDHIDVIFPILHGPFGEDGTVQGLLKLADIPFVGAGVLGSAIGMNKDVMKRLFRDAGLTIADFITIRSNEKSICDFDSIKKQFGVPFFIKPANLGSSVGVHIVKDSSSFEMALSDAFRFDNKILIEEYIEGREIECAVLGNENPIASVPGEILPTHEFYSYEAKYIDENGAALEIPANLPDEIIREVQELAILAFRVCSCEGMARVDCFLKKDGTVVINELNTIPGFTSISMYPMLWKASGIGYSELIDRLINLALERHKKEQKLCTDYLK